MRCSVYKKSPRKTVGPRGAKDSELSGSDWTRVVFTLLILLSDSLAILFSKRQLASLPAFAPRSAETLSRGNSAPDADSYSTSWMIVNLFCEHRCVARGRGQHLGFPTADLLSDAGGE